MDDKVVAKDDAMDALRVDGCSEGVHIGLVGEEWHAKEVEAGHVHAMVAHQVGYKKREWAMMRDVNNRL